MDLKLEKDANNQDDLDVTGGEAALVDGTEAIAQHLRIRLRMFKGEWFLNPSEGVPYFQKIFVKNPKTSLVLAIYRRIILETPGVDEITSFVPAYDPVTRKFSLTFEAKVDTGETLTFTDFVINE